MEIIDKWLEYVNRKELIGILALYNPQAILLPTFSERILDTPEKIRSYFERMFERQEFQASLHRQTIKEQESGNGILLTSGVYGWRYVSEGEPLTLEARFTFLLDLKQQSPILHHHSSQIPRML